MTHGGALLRAHVAVFFMGIAAVLAESSGFEAWRTTSYRVTFGGLMLLGLLLFRERKRPDLKKCALFLAMGLLLSVHWFAFFRSIELLGVMLGSAMLGFEPVVIALAARILLKERVNRRTKIAMGVSLLGFVALGFGSEDAGQEVVFGVAWSIFAFVLFAVLVAVNRSWVKDSTSGGSSLLLTTLEMLGAIPLSVAMTDGDWLPATSESWIFALTLGLLCTGLAYAFYNASMKVLSAPVVGLLLSMEVVYGLLGGRLIGDTLTPLQWVATLLISNILLLDLWAWTKARKKGYQSRTKTAVK